MLNLRAKLFSRENLSEIHRAAMKIMSEVGARVEHERTRRSLQSLGCRVQGDVVFFPEKVVESSVAEMVALGREKAQSLSPDRPKILPHATGQATACLDMDTDGLRPATRKDLIDATRVATALPDVCLGHPSFIPQDVPLQISDLYTLAVVAQYAPDSSSIEVYSLDTVDAFMEVATVIRGDRKSVLENPPFSYRVYGSSPFIFGYEKLELAWRLVDAGLQRGVYVGHVMPVLGASTPITRSGYLISLAAEGLEAAILHKAVTGQPRFFLGGPCGLDMRTMVSTQSSPDCMLLHLACLELSRFYGDPEPFFPYALSTDSKFPDMQAGVEKALKVMLAVAAGSREIVAGLGVLAQAGCVSVPQIVIDYEFCKMIQHMMEGISTDTRKMEEEVELIRKIGIGGSFIAEFHTAENFRDELYLGTLFDHTSLSSTRQHGNNLLTNAKEYVRKLLCEEPVEYLHGDQIREIERIIMHTQEKLVG